MEYHDNKVYFSTILHQITIAYGSFTIEKASIPSGQDPNNKNKPGTELLCGTDGTFCFSVGRHLSESVAADWKRWISAKQNTFGHDPKDLNFAFLGTLKLSLYDTNKTHSGLYIFDNVGLAQGRSGSTNNWWFGGQDCTYNDGWTVRCTGTKDGKPISVLFVRGDAPGSKTAPNQVRLDGIG